MEGQLLSSITMRNLADLYHMYMTACIESCWTGDMYMLYVSIFACEYFRLVALKFSLFGNLKL